MGRTQLSPQRLPETKKTNIGHIIIFCEGKTEKFYFDYFAEIIKKNKYTEVEVVLETANGNAQTVLKYANSFMADEEHNRKFNTYGKYLVFDCDDPPDIQSVVLEAKEYELLISNYLFKWLSQLSIRKAMATVGLQWDFIGYLLMPSVNKKGRGKEVVYELLSSLKRYFYYGAIKAPVE